MMIRSIALPITLALSCSAVFANPTPHSHGDRVHSHNLPKIGVAHKHGNLPIGTKLVNIKKEKKNIRTNSIPAKKTKKNKKMTGVEWARLSGKIEGTIILITTTAIGRFSQGKPELLKKNASKARTFIRARCKTSATEIRHDYPHVSGIFSRVFSKCTKHAIGKLNYYVN